MKSKMRLKFYRIISIVICLIMFFDMQTVTAFANQEEGVECWYCGHYHWDDYCCSCGACSSECTNSDCYEHTHCAGCGACLSESPLYCERYLLCEDCIENAHLHCAECFECYCDCPDELCMLCHRCPSCTSVCEHCHICEDCLGDGGAVHCRECGRCMDGGEVDASEYDIELCIECCLHCEYCDENYSESDGVEYCGYCGACENCFTNEDAGLHCLECQRCLWGEVEASEFNPSYCEECVVICEQCGECLTGNDEKEICDICGLCTDCCQMNSEDAGCYDGTCVEDPDFDSLFCPECNESFADVDKCETCGLCVSCCAINSECINGLCKEDDEYEEHFCELCGECFCNSEQCASCNDRICKKCCEELVREAGCDGSCGEEWCISDSGFEEHLETAHSGKTEHTAKKPESKWSYDESYHWHACALCNREDHISGKAIHTFDKYGKCTVCGYQKDSAIAIIKQPKDFICKVTDNTYSGPEDEISIYNNFASFTIQAIGKGPLKYQWQEHTGSGWRDVLDSSDTGVQGATTTKLIVPIAEDACDQPYYYSYRCVITDRENSTVTSQEAVVKAKHVFHTTYTEGGTQKVYEKVENIKEKGKPDHTIVVGGTEYKCESSLGHNFSCIGSHIEKVYEYNKPLPHEYGDWVILDGTDSSGKQYMCRTCEVCGYNQIQVYNNILIRVQPEDVKCKTSDHYVTDYDDAMSIVNNKVSFFVEAEGDTELSYQWKESHDGGSTWTTLSDHVLQWPGHPDFDDVEGATSDTLTVSVPSTACCDNIVYCCVITDEDGHTITTNLAKLDASHLYEAECSDGHGGTQTKVRGENVVKSSSDTIHYAYIIHGSGTTGRGDIYSGSTDGHRVMCLGDECSSKKKDILPHNFGDWKTVPNATWYICTGSNEEEAGCDYKFRTCQDCGYKEVQKVGNLTITKQPEDQQAYSSIRDSEYNYSPYHMDNNKVSFSIEAEGPSDAELNYQWQYYNEQYGWKNFGEVPNLSSSNSYEGYNTNTLTITVPVAACRFDNYKYRCIVSAQGVQQISDPAYLFGNHVYELEVKDENNNMVLTKQYENVSDETDSHVTYHVGTKGYIAGVSYGHREICWSCSKSNPLKAVIPHRYGDWESVGIMSDGNKLMKNVCLDCGYVLYQPYTGTATVTFDAGEGTCNTTTLPVGDDAKIIGSLPTATAPGEGGTFVGWCKASDNQLIDENTTYIEDTTVYAVYEYPIEIEGGYAVVEDKENQNDIHAVQPGKKVVLYANEVEGKVFSTWVVEKGNFTITSPKKASGAHFISAKEPMKIVAVYKDNTYNNCKVTFNMNGHGEQVPEQNLEKGGKVVKPQDPTAEGWIFEYWYGVSNEWDFDTPVSKNLILKAKWKKEEPGVGSSGTGTPGSGTPGSGTPGTGTLGTGTPGSGTPGTGTPGTGTPGSGTPGTGTPGSGTPSGTAGSGTTSDTSTGGTADTGTSNNDTTDTGTSSATSNNGTTDAGTPNSGISDNNKSGSVIPNNATLDDDTSKDDIPDNVTDDNGTTNIDKPNNDTEDDTITEGELNGEVETPLKEKESDSPKTEKASNFVIYLVISILAIIGIGCAVAYVMKRRKEEGKE